MKRIYDRYIEHNFGTRDPHPLKPLWFAFNDRALLSADRATPLNYRWVRFGRVVDAKLNPVVFAVVER